MRETLVVVVLAVAAAVIGLLSFAFMKNGTSAVDGLEDAPVAFQELARGDRSSVERRINYLVYSDAQLEQLWELIGAVDAPPEVDFTTATVIGIFSGRQPTAGYKISVDRIVDTETREMTITTSRPGASCFPAKTMTEPYQIILVPKTSLSYALEYVPTTEGCLR